MIAPPRLSIFNSQRVVAFDLTAIRRAVTRALPLCLRASRAGSPLAALDLISIGIVSDRAIARVHGEFFADPVPTDVITFDYGEILIGAGTVAENARRFAAASMDHEAALCAIHGLLHLGGWNDRDRAGARAMKSRQEAILRRAVGCGRGVRA